MCGAVSVTHSCGCLLPLVTAVQLLRCVNGLVGDTPHCRRSARQLTGPNGNNNMQGKAGMRLGLQLLMATLELGNSWLLACYVTEAIRISNQRRAESCRWAASPKR